MNAKLLVSMIVMMFFVAGAVSAYTVTGTVTGSGVGPIQNADVTAYNFTSGAVMDTNTTDASGAYSLTLPNVTAAYIFNVTAAGYNTASKTSLVNGDEVIDFILGPQPSVDITGIVYNAAGGIISGATVKAEYGGSTVDSTTTDGTGAYTLSVVDSQTYDVIASETGFISETKQITMSGNGVLDFNLTSAPTDGIVEGYVLNSTSGAVLPGATIRLMFGGGTVDSDTSDGTGYYSITAVGGTYDMEASLTGYNSDTENGVVITNGDTTAVNFSLIESPSCTDSDGDGYSVEGGLCGAIDCDDSNPSAYPGAAETCNGVNDDCDGYVDEGCSTGGNGGDSGDDDDDDGSNYRRRTSSSRNGFYQVPVDYTAEFDENGEIEYLLHRISRLIFEIEDEEHVLEVGNVYVDKVTLMISSTPISFTLAAGETKEFDLTGDGVEDVAVTLIERIYSRIKVRLKLLEQPVQQQQFTIITPAGQGETEGQGVNVGVITTAAATIVRGNFASDLIKAAKGGLFLTFGIVLSGLAVYFAFFRSKVLAGY
ncbi:carboxypeptidase regulatory-like domain-containing protein [Candidatus Woesearchaeota archaeon]|nr:carboxypeptidase regulatory-like domain-containing protein [Candidatus Woesearchaeota archaeon]